MEKKQKVKIKPYTAQQALLLSALNPFQVEAAMTNRHAMFEYFQWLHRRVFGHYSTSSEDWEVFETNFILLL